MRGYWAQVWGSVLAWMELSETERLYLEGAEDIDRVSGLNAETIQVKDVAGNITLRSGDVIEAIDNAWAHQQRNPRHTIKFRFLTTAGIGVEQGTPFGNRIGGLRLWRNSRSSADPTQNERDARAIATFLLAEGKVSAAVQAFLRAASDAQIWRQLIVPTEWDTEAEEAPEVIREIKDRLVVLGEKWGVTPDKAEDVAEHLYATAYATATRQKDRHLTRAQLSRLFYAERMYRSRPRTLSLPRSVSACCQPDRCLRQSAARPGQSVVHRPCQRAITCDRRFWPTSRGDFRPIRCSSCKVAPALASRLPPLGMRQRQRRHGDGSIYAACRLRL